MLLSLSSAAFASDDSAAAAQQVQDSSQQSLQGPAGERRLRSLRRLADNALRRSKHYRVAANAVATQSTDIAEKAIREKAQAQGLVEGVKAPATTNNPYIHVDVLTTDKILDETVDDLTTEAFRLSRLYPDREIEMRALLRGIPPKYHNIAEFSRALSGITQKVAKAGLPSNVSVFVAIDPRPFRDYNEMLAPYTILNVEGQAPLKVTGLIAGAWMMDQFERGSRGYLGVMGPTVDITEPDIMDYIKHRLATINWEDREQKARQRFWKRLDKPVIDLPTATADSDRFYDPSFEATGDIKLPNGVTVIKAGTRINPLAIHTYPRILAFFDPNSRVQLDAVKRYASTTSKPVKLIATRIAYPGVAPGEGAYEALVKDMDSPVYLYEAKLFDVFELKALPAFVQQDGTVWKISTRRPDTLAIAKVTP